MKKTRQPRKLVLERESIAHLDAAQLRDVAAGNAPTIDYPCKHPTLTGTGG